MTTTNQQAPKKGRGGYRKGAGRKLTTAKAYGFNAPQDVADILEATPKKTAYILEAIRHYHAYLQSQQ